MASRSEKRLRIFLSSTASAASSTDPDLRPERERAEAVLHKIAGEIATTSTIEIVRWEDSFYSATSSFQDQIVRPSDCDLVVFLFWKRLGSDLPPQYDRPDGTSRTGTEFEFEDAIEGALRSERKVPDILVYKKSAPITYHEDTVDRERADKRALDSFWTRWFQNEKGHFTAAFKTFVRTDEFASQFERDLRLWIQSREADSAWSGGSPFPGLAPFDEARSAVFFGRRRAIELARARLITAALNGPAFLLVVGASGSGKSSLVRAGLVPRLMAPGATPLVERFRRLVVTPSSLGEDVFAGLASALLGADVLPELRDGDYADPAALAQLFRTSPGNSAVPVAAALRRAASRLETAEGFDKKPDIALLLVVDQFEEMLGLGEDARAAFAAVLMALASAKAAWVVATFRSDLYENLQRSPSLLALKSAGLSIDLAPPTAGDIRDIIQRSAEAAGLTYEVSADGSRDLAQLLESEAMQPGALPMLAFALSRLYEERDQNSGTMLLARYDAMGGAAGALAQHGDAVLAALGSEAKAHFPTLVRRLVRISSAGTPVAATPQLDRFPAGTPLRSLLDGLREARLVVTYGEAENDGPSRVRVAHEALFDRWPAMHAQIAADRRDLETLERTTQALKIWQEAPRAQRGDRLLTGLALSESQDLLARWHDEVDADVATFVRDSAAVASRRRNLVRLTVAAFMLVLAGFGATATFFWLRATERTELAERQTEKAERETAAGQVTQSQFLAEKAEQALADDKVDLAALTALEALPRPGLPRPFVAEAMVPLYGAFAKDMIKLAVPQAYGGTSPSSLQSKQGIIAAGTNRQDVAFLDAQSGAYIDGFTVTDFPTYITLLAFADDRVSVVTSDKRISLWSRQGKKLREVDYGRAGMKSENVQLSLDARRAMICSNFGAQVVDLTTGEDLVSVPLAMSENATIPPLTRCEMSRSGRSLALWVAGIHLLRVFDVDAGTDRGKMLPDDILQVAISDDDSRIAVSLKDKVVASTLPELESFSSIVNTPSSALMQYSPDGSKLGITVEGKVALVDVPTGDVHVWDSGKPDNWFYPVFSADGSTLYATQTVHDAYAFRVDGKQLVVSSRLGGDFMPPLSTSSVGRDLAINGLGPVVVTDFLPIGKQSLGGHTKPLVSVTFSPDGRTVASASWDGKARLYDLATGRQLFEMGRSEGKNIVALRFNADGSRMLTTNSADEGDVWDTATGSRIAEFPGNQTASFIPGSSLLITNSREGLHVWDIEAQKIVADLEQIPDLIDIQVARDGKRALVWNYNGLSRIFDLPAASTVCTFQNPSTAGSGPPVLLPEGTGFLQRQNSSQLVLVDATTCAVSKVAELSMGGLPDAVSITSTGDRAVFPTEGGIAVVDSATLSQKLLLRSGQSVTRARISGDGTRVVGRLGDSSFAIWDVATGAKLATHPASAGTLANLVDPLIDNDGTIVILTSPPSSDVPSDQDASIWEVPQASDIIAWSMAAQIRPLREEERRALFLAPRPLRAEWPESPSPCDELGADVKDPMRVAPGFHSVAEEKTPAILTACREAFDKDPSSARYRVQLARALYLNREDAEAEKLLKADGGTRYPYGIYLRGVIAMRDPARSVEARAFLEQASGLGVAAADYRLWTLLQSGSDADKEAAGKYLRQGGERGNPPAEEMLATLAQKDALNAADPAGKRAAYVEAFRHWARAVHFMELQSWPANDSLVATARRGTLARYLRAEGLKVSEIAATYLEATAIKKTELLGGGMSGVGGS